jgi:hypothetical protein
MKVITKKLKSMKRLVVDAFVWQLSSRYAHERDEKMKYAGYWCHLVFLWINECYKVPLGSRGKMGRENL